MFFNNIFIAEKYSMVKNAPANAGGSRDMGSTPRLGKSLGVGNGNLLQYSCLENSMDREAWWAIIHEVAKSQTWLSDWALSIPWYGCVPYLTSVFNHSPFEGWMCCFWFGAIVNKVLIIPTCIHLQIFAWKPIFMSLDNVWNCVLLDYSVVVY